MATSDDFKDYFSGHAEHYANFRPTYPKGLFSFLAGCCERRELAWDCATGNGQAAVSLLEHFDTVFATDASARQIASASTSAALELRVAPAERSGLQSASVDLISVAQALHWFDLERFFTEAERVLRPGGILSVWCYEHCEVDPVCDHIIQAIFAEVEAYWPPERCLVEDRYAGITLPFDELETAKLAPAHTSMSADWSVQQMLGYMHTWSSSQRYLQENGCDPTERFADELASVWGTDVRTVRLPLTLRIARK